MASCKRAAQCSDIVDLDTTSASKKTKKGFRFSNEMIENLVTHLLEYKVKCEYNNIDFDADKPAQYTKIREEMAKYYIDDEDLFGPDNLAKIAENSTKEEKKIYNAKLKLVNRGYQRIREKIKDLRQGFSKAVLNGTRSGSGKMVYDHYDKLKQIWGGCPNTEPLSTGIDTSSVNTVVVEHVDALHDSDNEEEASRERDLLGHLDDFFGNQGPDDTISNASTKTPESERAQTPQSETQSTKSKDHAAILVDDKRKHLERRLSASQRDSLLLKEAKEDREERKEFREMMKNANDSFVHALDNMSQSMLSISNAIARSMEAFGNSSRPVPVAIPYYSMENQVTQQQGNEYFQLQPARSGFCQQNQ